MKPEPPYDLKTNILKNKKLFGPFISNLLHEQKTQEERDQYLYELERHKFELKATRKIQKSFLPETIP